KSIQELIRGLHQCLVAEVYRKPGGINTGATPASSDQLAQRNLVIVESDNPGDRDSHTVAHTFEIRASSPEPQRAPQYALLEPGGELRAGAVDPVLVKREALGAEPSAISRAEMRRGLEAMVRDRLALARTFEDPPDPWDELMILWGDLPRASRMTLYFSAVPADEI